MGNAMDRTYETDKTNGTGAAGAGAPRRAPELLAPVGGPDAGYAALQYGADAVYLGLKAFSARAEADNFDFVALDEFTTYAHSLPRPRRVYAAVNTLVQERELPALRAALGRLAAARVDAAIVQDLGVARAVLADFPEIRLHVSTQMAVHDVATARFFASLGARRVTLARELTLPEIREIAAIPGLEAEFFLHGALCYSYSGLCLFSSHLMGRSANRGRCAYPCRDFFAVDGDPARAGHLFSMKDLALWRELPQLFATGVASLKIEGRKKSPLYVAAAVDFYRRLFDACAAGEEPDPAVVQAGLERLQSVFSRETCSLFVGNADRGAVVDPAYVGHRGAPAGTVEKVAPHGGGFCLCFRAAVPLERHDGLQLGVPGAGRPYGFAVDEMAVVEGKRWRRVFAAGAGQEVAVRLPPDAPRVAPGTAVWRAASQEARRHFPLSRPRPGEWRGRAWLRVTVAFAPAELRARAEVMAPGEAAAMLAKRGAVTAPPGAWANPRLAGRAATAAVAGDFPVAQKPEKIEPAVRAALEKTAEYPFTLGELVLDNPERRFAPASLLNELRRELYAALLRQCPECAPDDDGAGEGAPGGEAF